MNIMNFYNTHNMYNEETSSLVNRLIKQASDKVLTYEEMEKQNREYELKTRQHSNNKCYSLPDMITPDNNKRFGYGGDCGEYSSLATSSSSSSDYSNQSSSVVYGDSTGIGTRSPY